MQDAVEVTLFRKTGGTPIFPQIVNTYLKKKKKRDRDREKRGPEKRRNTKK